jgi:hypothetical protein
MYNFYDDYNDYDYYQEGANLDIRAKLKEATKLYNKNMKDIQKALKAGEYNNARRNIETLRRSLADLREDIEKIDASEIGSIVFGLYTAFTINWLRKLVMILLAIPTLGISLGIEEIRSIIEAWGRPASKFANGEPMSGDDVNAYKNTALERMNYLIGTLKRLDRNIQKLANTKGKKVKATATEVKKESAAYDFKKALYEACNNGLITLSEREELIDRANTNTFIEVANNTTYGYDFLSTEDKFKQVRRVLYERCNNREISEDERDELLLNARRKFYK